MKICLIQPPINDFYETEIRNIPLGLLSIGANLNEHDIHLADLRKGARKTLPVPDVFSDLKQYYKPDDKSPFGLYKNYYRFGLSVENFDSIIPEDSDLYCISAMFTTYSENVIEIINFLKMKRPKCKIVVGGHACAAMPGSFISEGADFEIYGEGELTLSQLVEAIDNKESDVSPIPNLIWQKDDEIIINQQKFIDDLDSLKFANYTLPGVPDYKLGRKKHAMLMISRGCPNHCSFCSIHQVMGHRYRTRSVENVLAELDEKIAQGFRSFDFEDDHFGGNRKWLNCLLDEIIERYSDYELSFQAMNGITATNLDEELLVKMRQIGFSSLNLALVSEKKIEQNNLNRPFNTEKFTNLVYLAKKHDFFITAYLILGLPNHTIEEMLESILFLSELPVLIGPSFFYLVPNTPIFDACELSAEILSDKRTFRSSYMPFKTDNFNRRDLVTLFRITRIINFHKALPSYEKQYSIHDSVISLSNDTKGFEIQQQTGLALIELLKSESIIYGLKKIDQYSYEIREEVVNRDIVRMFLDRYNL